MRDRHRDPLIHCQLVILKSRLDSETTQISLPVKDFTFHGLPRRCLLVVENLPATAGEARDVGLIPGWGRSPEVGHGNPFLYSCLESPHGQRILVGYSLGLQSRTCLEQLSTHVS